jgi:Ca-activated chloride channel homolog
MYRPALSHLKLGNRDKRVLLAITDGEDNASRYTFDELIRAAQRSNAVVYCIGLLGDEQPGGLFKIRGSGAEHAAKVLKQVAEVTGGQAYFPKSLDEVESTCVQIAHDIRNQYTLAYYPTNTNKDGTFRTVRVEAFAPGTHNKLQVRTKTGYYAARVLQSGSASGKQQIQDHRE